MGEKLETRYPQYHIITFQLSFSFQVSVTLPSFLSIICIAISLERPDIDPKYPNLWLSYLWILLVQLTPELFYNSIKRKRQAAPTTTIITITFTEYPIRWYVFYVPSLVHWGLYSTTLSQKVYSKLHLPWPHYLPYSTTRQQEEYLELLLHLTSRIKIEQLSKFTKSHLLFVEYHCWLNNFKILLSFRRSKE